MSIKRNRSVNWDEEEKQLFRNVLKDYTDTIEDKRLSTESNKLKAKAWEEVHKKFNSINSRKRDLNQLKIQWKCMKIHARRIYGQFKKDINKTGGGTRPATPDEANTTRNSALKSRKDRHEYINEIITHSKLLKEREFHRRMEMAEEKHALEINHLKEKHALEMKLLNLKHANLVREIAEKKLQL